MAKRFFPTAFLVGVSGLLASGCLSPPSSLAGKTGDGGPGNTEAMSVDKRAEAYAHYATGMIHEMHGRQEEAWDEFYQAAKGDPGHHSLVAQVARRLLNDQEAEKARGLLEKSLQYPEPPGALFAYLGLAHAQMGNTQAAIKFNRRAIEDDPTTLQAYQNLARMYRRQGKAGKALKVLQQASKVESPSARFLIRLAEMFLDYSRLSEFDEDAIRPTVTSLLDEAAAREPSQPQLMVKLGDLFARLQETKRARQYYSQVADKFPDWPGIREKLAQIYLQTGQRDRAAKELRALVKQRPEDPTSYYFLGKLAREKGNLTEAAEYFRTAMQLQPQFQPVYYELAGVHVDQNQPTQAISVLEKARSKFQPTFVGEFYSALAHLQIQAYSEAIRHFTEAEVIAGANNNEQRLNHIFYFQAGIAHEQNQDYEQAASYFQKAIERRPQFTQALNYLGYMWAEQGIRLEKAHRLIKKAVKLEPDNAAFLDSLGWVLFKRGQIKKAESYLLKAIEKAENPDATLYEHLGDIYAKSGQSAKAREAWKKALEIKPTESVKRKLADPTGEKESKPKEP